jgi:hypothetical protein
VGSLPLASVPNASVNTRQSRDGSSASLLSVLLGIGPAMGVLDPRAIPF